ncbi:MAG: Ig-like domain-containing protein [Terriglobales bacterium]
MRLRACGFALFVLFSSALSMAQTQAIVTFAHLKDLEYIGNFYDGGAGPNFGLQFTANAQAIISASKGGSGNFINNPGGYPVMFFQTGQSVTMTATNGIQTGLWFYYSALQAGVATVYSGPNGTGNILASVTLTPNNSGCTGYKLCVWSPVGVPLSATAGSISFAGVPDYLAIGDIHLGHALPTSTALTSSQNPSVQGDPVTFTATVTALGTTAVGNVTFKAANQVVGVVPTVSGMASITLSSLKTGSTHINAKFQGTGFGNSAAILVQVVN